jgi:hypothetical protein
MRLILVLALFISVSGHAQWKDYTLNAHGDTLNRLDMQGKKQGPWVIHVDELRGERGFEEEGYFDNDMKEGLWKKFSLEGVKIAEENYRWGKLDGRSRFYTYNGGLLREESWRAIDPKQKFDTVAIYDLKDPDKVIKNVVVKNEGVAMKHGKWIYYDPSEGTVEKTETYVMNKLQTNDNALVGDDDDIKPLKMGAYKAPVDSAGHKIKPAVVQDYEKKNAGKKKVKTRDGATGY